MLFLYSLTILATVTSALAKNPLEFTTLEEVLAWRGMTGRQFPPEPEPPVPIPARENLYDMLRGDANPIVEKQSSCSCGVLNPNGASGTRIVGGTETLAGEIPWRVFVFIYDPNTSRGSGCGGTIISNSWIMTAAHCLTNFQPGYQILVWAGAQSSPLSTDNGDMYMVDTFKKHPGYVGQTKDNDIALFHVSSPIVYKPNVSPACLPWNLISQDFSGTNVLASGWGSTNPVPVGVQNTDPGSDTLLKVTLPVLTTTECRQYLWYITDNMFCTYLPGSDTCQGDSGGSVDYQADNGLYYAIGIVSFGSGCAQENYPGVYAKVTNYLTWIQSNTGTTSYCKI